MTDATPEGWPGGVGMRTASWIVWMVCAGALGCATPRNRGASPVMVDLSVQVLNVWLRAVVPGPDGAWWAMGETRYDPSGNGDDRAIEVFRSSDEGRSWQPAVELARALNTTRAEADANGIGFLTWYTPEIGLAAGYLGQRAFRTVDGGKTWKTVPLVDEQGFSALERAGNRTWLCGSSGRILRSEDQGASWQELATTPFDTQDACEGLSFLSPDHGWAIGHEATLWATEDGGNSWKPLTQPFQRLRGPVVGPSVPARLNGVVRLTPELAWVRGTGGLYQTTDGGRSWSAPIPEEDAETSSLSVSLTPDGRHIVTRTPVGLPLEQWIPSFEEAWVFSHDSVVAFSPDTAEVSVHVGGQLVRRSPMLTFGRGPETHLDGFIQQGPRRWWGWSGDQVMASHDAGNSWFPTGRTSGHSIRALVPLRDGTLLAGLWRGGLMRSSDEGRTWVSGEGLEAYDFARVLGQEAPESPLACLLSTPDAVLEIEFDANGCFAATRNTLELRLQPEGARLMGELQTHLREPPDPRVDKVLERAVGEQLMRQLVEAASRPEEGMHCQSTTRIDVRMAWSCGSGSWRTAQYARFTGSLCSSWSRSEAGGGERSVPYERGNGVFRAAEALLEDATPARPADVPGAQPGATR
ncbi:hypothetical protein D7X74_27860 [Corallococcus sp. CA047B]|nr:hypothetical protein D7X74_27860 [Corallococcus sp. CA047B]